MINKKVILILLLLNCQIKPCMSDNASFSLILNTAEKSRSASPTSNIILIVNGDNFDKLVQLDKDRLLPAGTKWERAKRLGSSGDSLVTLSYKGNADERQLSKALRSSGVDLLDIILKRPKSHLFYVEFGGREEALKFKYGLPEDFHINLKVENNKFYGLLTTDAKIQTGRHPEGEFVHMDLTIEELRRILANYNLHYKNVYIK